MSPEARESPSMRKQVVQRNFLKKMKTAGPTDVNEVTELNETTMRQSTNSKFDVKSGFVRIISFDKYFKLIGKLFLRERNFTRNYK